ncbi:MAG: hypothetical protein IT209_10145 [Armatimonadetes bacterium]|nr:hypothetical protein [Armatimonadota bacterium]
MTMRWSGSSERVLTVDTGAVGALDAGRPIHSLWAVVSPLLALKWRLMIRGYLRNSTALVGVLVTVLVLLPTSILLGFGAFAALRFSPPDYTAHILRAVMLSIYLLWVLTPLFGYALNESYDLKRLFIYPLTMRQIFVGSVAGSLMDFTVLLLFPILGAVVLSFTYGPFSFVFTGIVILLFLFQTLALGQALMLLGQSLLSARRARDILIVLGPLLGAGVYLAVRYFGEAATHFDWAGFLAGPVWGAVEWLPPGLAAHAIVSVSCGQIPGALAALALLVVLTIATVYAAGALLHSAYMGSSTQAHGRGRKALDQSGVTSSRTWSARLLPPVVSAMFDKEIRYILREPYYKLTLTSVLYMVAISGMFLFTGRVQMFERESSFLIWGASVYILMVEMGIPYNAFGTDGFASATLLSFPASRRQILLGKNLGHFVFLTLVNAVAMLVPVAVLHQWRLYGLLMLWLVLAVILMTAVGNPISVKLPVRVTTRAGRLRRTSAGQGCGLGFIYLAANALTAAIMLPVLAALIAPYFWVRSIFFVFTIPFALVYTAFFYLLSLHLTEPVLLSNEVEMIAKLSVEDS